MPLRFDGLKVYTLPELSKKLNISTLTLRKYVREGRLKGQKIARRWLVTEEDAKKFLSGTSGEEALKTENTGQE
jgi:excisionase family DNA binding protein